MLSRKKLYLAIIISIAVFYGGVIVARTAPSARLSAIVNSVMLCNTVPEEDNHHMNTHCISNDGIVTIIRSHLPSRLQDSAIVIP